MSKITMMANDRRWQKIDTFDDLTALIVDIAEAVQVIISHSRSFNPINPVENLNQIRKESECLMLQIRAARDFIETHRNELNQQIRSDYD